MSGFSKVFNSFIKSSWANKVFWQIISFKFLSFWCATFLLVSAWFSLQGIFDKYTYTAERLQEEGHITKDGLVTLLTHAQTVMYDSALSHLLIFFAAIFASVFAVKGISYMTEARTTSDVLKRLPDDTSKEDLKQFLPKEGK